MTTPRSIPATDLPIEAALPELMAALAARSSAVLQAPPGAGKTTRVPLALLEADWLGARRLVMLEPRRLAARAAARRMASLLDEEVGETVGYRVRQETRVGPRTRIEVVTEGILARMLTDDPALEAYGAVVFDEYHERSLHADLGLALALEAQAVLRPELRLLAMSATLDGSRVAALMDDAPVVTSEGRAFPVETIYLPERPGESGAQHVGRAVREALRDAAGDVLVFLPGAAEIRRAQAALLDPPLGDDVELHTLAGSLSAEAQDAALAPASAGRRKVVLSTSIAETSLTIPGVRTVVDAGWERRLRFRPRTGMARLETIRVSRAAADQRRGRAGRVGPGRCVRLWSRAEQERLQPFSPPEIVDADLAGLALTLHAWGTHDPSSLRWLDPPPAGAYAQAESLLSLLGALDADGRLTAHGRALARLGLHPRLASMVVAGARMGAGKVACELAALLSERDVIQCQGRPAEADLRLRLQLLRGGGAAGAGCTVHRGGLARVRELARHLMQRARVAARRGGGDVGEAGVVLAHAYPDRLAARAEGSDVRFRMRTGQTAALDAPQVLSDAAFLVVADLDGHAGQSRIALAAPIEEEDLTEAFASSIETEDRYAWDDAAGRVRASERVGIGALTLRERTLPKPDPERVADVLLAHVLETELRVLPWSRAAVRVRERIAFLHAQQGEWPDVSDAALMDTAVTWLRPHLHGLDRASQLDRLDLTALLLGMLDWRQRGELDRLAPTHIEVPSGSRIAIDYSDPDDPVLAVRLQEMFGATETPCILDGRHRLTLHLLSPAQRPVQVTSDLASFWKDAYFDVRKDLRGRYVKHYWPENPLEAEPTRRAKPRKR